MSSCTPSLGGESTECRVSEIGGSGRQERVQRVWAATGRQASGQRGEWPFKLVEPTGGGFRASPKSRGGGTAGLALAKLDAVLWGAAARLVPSIKTLPIQTHPVQEGCLLFSILSPVLAMDLITMNRRPEFTPN